MQRDGMCHCCGECCQTVQITAKLGHALTQHRSVDEIKLYYSYRQIKVVGVDFHQDALFLEIPIPCQQLDQSNHCQIHGEPHLKPLLCHLYPAEPDDIQQCGFHFSESAL